MSFKTQPYPHLIPAIRNWLLESFDTIRLHVDASQLLDPSLIQMANDGVLVLSVGPNATPDFTVDEDGVHFSARFGGQHRVVSVPSGAVIRILGYDALTPQEQYAIPIPHFDIEETQPKPKPKPGLRVVK